MEIISSSQLSWSRDTWGNSETLPVARFPCTLSTSILKHIKPTTLGNGQQCHILNINAMNSSPSSFSPPIFSLLFLHCCSSYVHSPLTVIFTLVMLAGAGHPFSSIRHCSSSVFDEYWRWRPLPNLHFRISLIIQHKLSPSPTSSIPLPRCQTRSWARFL